MKRLTKWSAARLYQENSSEELTVLAAALTSDPENANPGSRANGGSSIYLYTKETHRRLAAIAQAITWHLQNRRVA